MLLSRFLAFFFLPSLRALQRSQLKLSGGDQQLCLITLEFLLESFIHNEKHGLRRSGTAGRGRSEPKRNKDGAATLGHHRRPTTMVNVEHQRRSSATAPSPTERNELRKRPRRRRGKHDTEKTNGQPSASDLDSRDSVLQRRSAWPLLPAMWLQYSFSQSLSLNQLLF